MARVLTLQQNDLSQNQKLEATIVELVLTLQQNDLSQNKIRLLSKEQCRFDFTAK